ncbi:MAG: hypothetical protein JSV82_04670 [Planctomycetota bacterium]|nr:MAG: hypothetical protein JSV82_04670 [Planctomycetota bacterium]
MIEGQSSHWQIVAESLTGERVIDEQSFASLTILTERLERLKKLDKSFDSIEFSPAIRELAKQKDAVAIG